jgi:lipoprotein-anchoring transpeptidase ErfK/SrfK
MQIIKLAAVLITTGSLEVFAEQPSRRVVVSIPDRKLALIANGRVVKVYPIAVGKAETPSPTGSFRVVSRVIDPTWYTKGKIVPPGPANPLGNRWIGLSERGYGIHGTNVQSSVGHAASHGCIRMRKADVEELFKLVEIGDPVEFRDEVSAIAFVVAQQPAVNQITEAGESQ